MAYLIDADAFIRAKNLHYGFDFCPAFWDWLIAQNAAGAVFSNEKIEGELLAVDDQLSRWTTQRGPAFFLRLTDAIVPSLAAVGAWARSPRYEPSAVETFLQKADYYLVAQAHAGGHTVVSHEVPSDSRWKIKIPDACLGLRVPFVTPYEMLRRERARFVLGPSA